MRDADVRASVIEMLASRHDGDIDTRIVQEMGIWSGAARIDVAVINGELIGYELKSERDTLDRLPAQAELYGRVFDRVFLVVSKKHVFAARKVIPTWWGITVAELSNGKVALKPRRQAKPNPCIDGYLLAKLLWRDEALRILSAKQLAKGWRTRSVDDLHRRLATELPLADLSSVVRAALKERDAWLRQPLSNQGEMTVCSNSDPSASATTSR